MITTTKEEHIMAAQARTGMARQASPEASRARAFRQSRLASRSVHTESLPNVRSFTRSPYESLMRTNSRAF